MSEKTNACEEDTGTPLPRCACRWVGRPQLCEFPGRRLRGCRPDSADNHISRSVRHLLEHSANPHAEVPEGHSRPHRQVPAGGRSLLLGERPQSTDRRLAGCVGIRVSGGHPPALRFPASQRRAAEDRHLNRQSAHRKVVRTPLLDRGLRGTTSGWIQPFRWRSLCHQEGRASTGGIRTTVFCCHQE